MECHGESLERRGGDGRKKRLEEKGRQVQKLLWGKKGRIYKTAEGMMVYAQDYVLKGPPRHDFCCCNGWWLGGNERKVTICPG